MDSSRRLTRSRHERIIAGVCAGLADYLGLDVTLVRVGFVILSFITGAFPGILAYLVLWFLMPEV